MLIDRDKLLRLAKSERETCGKDYDFYGLLSDIEHAPTVDAAPVVHGRWEDYGHCSCCGWGWSDLVYDRTEQMSRMNYCPHCGACMDLEEQDADNI